MNLWQRLRAVRRRSRRRRDEAAAERALVEHERQERENAKPDTPIPPMRNNTDWAGWAGPF